MKKTIYTLPFIQFNTQSCELKVVLIIFTPPCLTHGKSPYVINRYLETPVLHT